MRFYRPLPLLEDLTLQERLARFHGVWSLLEAHATEHCVVVTAERVRVRPCPRPHARRSEVRPMPLTELPFGLPGRIFRSPMPFGPYDLHGDAYDCFCAEQIAVIVLLASDAECLHKSGCHLRTLYHQAGFQVVDLPIPDFGVPARADLEQAIQHTLAHAQAGRHIVVHCSAGLGRTGLFLASLAKRALGLSGAEAIQWVRQFLPQAIETPEQQRLLLHDEEA